MKPYIRIQHFLTAALAAVAALLTVSCDKVLFDDEGDCDVVYRLRFRYDWNMKYADAFPHEVKSVNLYAFDSEGKLIWQTVESGSRLAAEDYSITLPLPAGSYSLLAWCGVDGGESFTIPEVRTGDTPESLHCRLNRTSTDAGAVSADDLHHLFHGTLDVDLPANDDGGEYTYTMGLKKDTNVFRIVLQHLSGKDIDADDFTFRIEDHNGWLNHDNTLRDDEKITYHAWDTYSGTAGVDLPAEQALAPADDSRAITEVKVAVAELTTSRLTVRDGASPPKPMLIIRKADGGDLVARIPVTDYALLVKGNYHRPMDDQEYLDRQDEYNMTFFLDDNLDWISTSVIINSWRVVLNPSDID